MSGITPRPRAVVPLLPQPILGQDGTGARIGIGALGHGGSNQLRRQLSHPRLQATVKQAPWTSQRPRPRSPPRPRRGDESRPKSAGISLSENPTWLKRSATPERAEPSAPLRLRPNVKTEIEDEIHAAAAEIAAGDPIEVSDEENDWKPGGGGASHRPAALEATGVRNSGFVGHGPPEPAPTDGRSPLSSSSPHCIPNVGRSSFEAAGHFAVFEQRPESHSVLHIECNGDENHVPGSRSMGTARRYWGSVP